MRASLDWMREYVETGCSPEELAARLAELGFEVEEIEYLPGAPPGIIVARITRLEPHPDVPDWQVARLDAGKGTVTVVTGASNISAGDLVPLALPGSKLSDGREITEQMFRGVLSQGMLCSSAELGIASDTSGILLLPPELEPGSDIGPALGLSADQVLGIETLQRADCLCYMHMAKEMAVALGTTWREPAVSVREDGEDGAPRLNIQVTAPDLCPRYAARIITDIRLAPSPWWMARRLLASGVRPINNLVDITNYVMLEMNQPLHAFDFDKLSGSRIIVRRAAPGETITTLDGNTRTLDPEMLVIADAEKPVAVAGVMGGLDSEITACTRTVLLESACFEASSNRRTSTRLGLRTEASIRFGKGIDCHGVLRALDRAAQLIEELGVGKVARGAADITHELPGPVCIPLRPRRVNRILGTSLSTDEMVCCLKRLSFEVHPAEDEIIVGVPTYRGDIGGEVDLVEEIARVYGYDRIPASFPVSAGAGGLTPVQQAERRLRSDLSGLGLNEAVTWSMVDPDDCTRLMLPPEHPWCRAPRVLMPMSEDRSMMRPSLMFGLVGAVSHNARRQQTDLRLFEIGRVFGELPSSGRELPEEHLQLGIIITGRDTAGNWQAAGRDADFYELKGIVETLLDRFGHRNARFEPVSLPGLHPGRTAQISLGRQTCGFLGELHPQVCQTFELPERVYYAQIDLPNLLNGQPVTQYRQLPRYPAVERDLAMIVPETVPAARVAQCITQAGGALLEGVHLFDVYRGGQVPEGWKSLAFSLSLRHNDRTLTESDVSQVMQDILDAAAIELGAHRR